MSAPFSHSQICREGPELLVSYLAWRGTWKACKSPTLEELGKQICYPELLAPTALALAEG